MRRRQVGHDHDEGGDILLSEGASTSSSRGSGTKQKARHPPTSVARVLAQVTIACFIIGAFYYYAEIMNTGEFEIGKMYVQ